MIMRRSCQNAARYRPRRRGPSMPVSRPRRRRRQLRRLPDPTAGATGNSAGLCGPCALLPARAQGAVERVQVKTYP